jgi:hypothetical protein
MEDSPEKEQAFYAALGRAVASWQAIEMRLGLLFSLALQSKGTTALAFDCIISFRDKLNAVDAVLQKRLRTASSHLTRWRSLSKRITRLVRRRNKVAHAHVAVVHEEGREPEMWAGPPSSRMGPIIASRAEKQHLLNTHKLELMGRAFDLAAREVATFTDEVRGTLLDFSRR